MDDFQRNRGLRPGNDALDRMTPANRALYSSGHAADREPIKPPLLAGFDLQLTKPVARSIRLNGKSTCIRLELAYWRILERTAQQQGVPVNRVISQLDLEVQQLHGEVINFSSLVRVVSVATLLRAAGQPL